ncbi:MAG: sucrose phosphorylase [Bacteroidales bacterium]|nr:sucrose phosphorylase [Bacteroidales bacterium]
MRNKVQLITYVNRLGCENIGELRELFQNEFKDIFGGIHILPFFYPFDGEDAGFDPIDHLSVDPRLGNWDDIELLSREVDVMADLIVNHVSAQSPQFTDYLLNGEKSPFADLFLTYGKIFPDGASEQELLNIYRPRPGLPFTTFTFNNGTAKLVWTTFTANQVDIDVNSKQGQSYLDEILQIFRKSGIKMIRLDAAGYALKERGTSCFMTDKTFAFIDHLTQKARKLGITVLVEIHSHHQTQIEIAKKVDYVYDFALPVLVLDTLFNRDASNLKKWLEISPRNAFTVLDTHDGIGVVDVASEKGKPGLIEDQHLDEIVNKMHKNSGGESLKATGAAASNLDLYQVNCTYYDALGGNDKMYLMARAIQFFAPGIPQIYYTGFFAGNNDMELLSKTRVGRDINRHFYTKEQITTELKRPVVKKLIDLIKFRNTHPAFNGQFSLVQSPPNKLEILWKKNDAWTRLKIDLANQSVNISFTPHEGLEEITIN